MIDARLLRTLPHGRVIGELLAAAIDAVDPRRAVRAAIEAREPGRLRVGPHELVVPTGGRLRVVGAGKAVEAMARGAIDSLGARIDDGLVIAKHRRCSSLAGPRTAIEVELGDHPVPGPQSVRASAALRRRLADGRAEDLVLCLVSGGASALLCEPRVELGELQDATRVLLHHRVSIGELNGVRRALDRLKAGGLARAAAPARVLGLLVSDVLGDDPRDIGSGPTAACDPAAARAEALEVLARLGLADRIPPAILATLAEPPPIEPPARVIDNLIVARNLDACEAARACAARHGWAARVDPEPLTGEARVVGEALARRLLAEPGANAPSCVVLGGETTVEVRGDGLGGRNQELALAAARILDGAEDRVLVAFASDGEDGPTRCAGAIVDGSTATRAREAGLDPAKHLRENDSHRLFAALGDALSAGATGTNVGDLVLLVRL